MDGLIPETESQVIALPQSPRKRRRPALSCAECRRRKIKCDRKIPCDPCRKANSATCTYSPEGLSSLNDHVPLSLTSHGHSPLSLRDASNEGTRAFRRDSDPEVLGHPATSDSFFDDTTSTSGHSFSDIQPGSGQNVSRHLLQRVGKIEKILSTVKIDGQRTENGKSRSPPARGLRGSMSKNRYFGHSHWMSAVAENKSFMCFDVDFDDSDDEMKMRNKELETAINSALYNCKVMARAIKSAQFPQWTIWGVSFQHTMPDRTVADELVGHYLRTHESVHRILHIPSFQKEYAQYWANPQTTSTVSLIKILLVIAIGTCFHQGPDFDSRRTQAIHWVHTAQFWLASPKEKNRLHTACIQVECLLLLARSIYNIGADIIWNHTGSVLRTAMSMGFHRDLKHSKRYSILHKEVRRRLWATILEIDIQACLDSGMSPMISKDDFDTEPPSNINDDEIDESTATHPGSHPLNEYTQASLQIATLSSLSTRLEAANLVNDYRVEISYEAAIKLGKALVRNYKEHHLFFARASQDISAKFKPTAFDRKMFDLKIQRFLLVLHRPFAMKARDDPRFYYSHKIYLDTALAVHSTPSGSLLPTPDSDNSKVEDDYTRFRLISGGFLKEMLIHTVIIIYQEMIMPLEQELPGFFPDETKSSRGPYLSLLQDMIDLAQKRLEAGETAVKSHLLYSIALAHINAIENGTPVDDAMAEAATSSLSQCQEILKRKMPSTTTTTLEAQFSDEMGQVPDMGAGDMDFSMQDWGMEFEPSDLWLFSGWPLPSARDSAF
ncbi:fungal-specific transcription factor domain-containing protein [Amylocarpus encephaloides]|uniref:Fungal-specific transcription factor domain-containing protein n=1 Tax=Amylocarpus encephaloides TaxID=45428 RepID=A0A9P7YMM6_9HELO|nr:fungal-specific transcription factor domain-containing protein [Amylocarpus encephaloides]